MHIFNLNADVLAVGWVVGQLADTVQPFIDGLTGSFVVETVFNLPGLGFLTIDAIRKGDMPVIQTCVLLTGAMFIFLNLIVDLMLPILDPRIRESQV